MSENRDSIIPIRALKLTSIPVVNFIQKDLPKGSTTGAGFLIKPGSGALGMGQRASTGLTTCEPK